MPEDPANVRWRSALERIADEHQIESENRDRLLNLYGAASDSHELLRLLRVYISEHRKRTIALIKKINAAIIGYQELVGVATDECLLTQLPVAIDISSQIASKLMSELANFERAMAILNLVDRGSHANRNMNREIVFLSSIYEKDDRSPVVYYSDKTGDRETPFVKFLRAVFAATGQDPGEQLARRASAALERVRRIERQAALVGKFEDIYLECHEYEYASIKQVYHLMSEKWHFLTSKHHTKIPTENELLALSSIPMVKRNGEWFYCAQIKSV